MKNVLAASSLMLIFVFAGCSASGPFQPHSAFKQAVLPAGYQNADLNPTGSGTRGAVAPLWRSPNSPAAFSPQQGGAQYGNWNPAYGDGVAPQAIYGYRGQAAYPNRSQGLGGRLISPFVGGTYSNGSC